MLDCKDFYEALEQAGVSFFTGVPDSLLKSFCAYLSDHAQPSEHVIAANEGSAVAMAAGHHLASGKLPLVYMQNSGLGNAFNPLVSLADREVYGFPMLLLIGWRGEPGKKDEPQHRKMGEVTIASLDALGIRHKVLPSDPAEALAVLSEAASTASETCEPFALVVPKGTFEVYKLQSAAADRYSGSREQAIAAVLEEISSETTVIATTGMPSRELFELREQRSESHDSDFLTVGSMGHCSQIALGVALQQPERHVLCLDGDGAAIMQLGGLATIGDLAPKNYTHVVLNNGAHDSVGGQPTVGFEIDLCAIARGCGYTTATSVADLAEVPAAMRELLSKPGPRFLEIRVKKGARSDLGRPTRSPKETKEALMRFLQD